jgi:hypothetical protein
MCSGPAKLIVNICEVVWDRKKTRNRVRGLSDDVPTMIFIGNLAANARPRSLSARGRSAVTRCERNYATRSSVTMGRCFRPW